MPGINLMDEKAVNDRKCIFGSMNSSHNIALGDADVTLQYLWCIEGDWKLLLRYHGEDTTHYRALHAWDTAPYRLYNLKKDPGEKHDVADAHPERVARLKAKIEAWRPVRGPVISSQKSMKRCITQVCAVGRAVKETGDRSQGTGMAVHSLKKLTACKNPLPLAPCHLPRAFALILSWVRRCVKLRIGAGGHEGTTIGGGQDE